MSEEIGRRIDGGTSGKSWRLGSDVTGVRVGFETTACRYVSFKEGSWFGNYGGQYEEMVRYAALEEEEMRDLAEAGSREGFHVYIRERLGVG